MGIDGTSGKLYVVRNSVVQAAAGMRLEDWKLSPAGVLLTIPIAEAGFWSGVASIYHGPEVSSEQTARVITRRWRIRAEYEWDLREFTLLPVPMYSDSSTGAGHTQMPGFPWEDSQQAQRRVVRCIQRLADRHAGQSFAVVAQGRILLAFFGYLLGRSLGQDVWGSFPSPDLSVIDLATWTIEWGFLAT